MIKISKIMRADRYCSCDHCNVEGQPFYLKYEFIDKPKREEPYVELILCEDCSCMMSRLHFDCMKEGDSYQYEPDIGHTERSIPRKQIPYEDWSDLKKSYYRGWIDNFPLIRAK